MIYATDIPDAWFQAIVYLQNHGRRYTIDQGSFAGEERIEADFISIAIAHPYAEPYDMMLPKIPVSYGIPDPVAPGYIEQYLPYLMTATKKLSEDYTYGERLTDFSYWQLKPPYQRGDWCQFTHNQVEHFIKLLKRTPNTNQAVLQIAAPEDCFLEDPPCLRSIHLKVINGKLVAMPYFRSNDLWSGFPANLAAIAILQKYIADEIGLPSGEMIYFCTGLHIYGYVEEMAKIRTGRNK